MAFLSERWGEEIVLKSHGAVLPCSRSTVFIAVCFKALRSEGTSSFFFDILIQKFFCVKEPLLFIIDYSFDDFTYFVQNSPGASANLQILQFIPVLAATRSVPWCGDS